MSENIQSLARSVLSASKGASPLPWSEDDGNIFSQPLSEQRFQAIVRRVIDKSAEPHPDEGSPTPLGFVATTLQQVTRYDNETYILAACNAAPRLAEALLEAEEERARLQAIIDTHDLCHNLHGKVDARAFADGCAEEQRKHFGCAPDADDAELGRLVRQMPNGASLTHCFELWQVTHGPTEPAPEPSQTPEEALRSAAGPRGGESQQQPEETT